MKALDLSLPLWLLTIIASLIQSTLATSWMSSSDLTSFISRPELKVPRLLLKKHHPNLLTPGYIFLAPYIRAENEAYTKYYQPCQIGPNIYDFTGELVWSGACLFSNRNAFDFKLNRDGGNGTVLSVILGPIRNRPGSNGFAMILSPTLEVTRQIQAASDIQASYMHEFSVLDGGDTTISIHAEYRSTNVSVVSKGNHTTWKVRDEGFREVDLRDGGVRFEWWAMGHVAIEETFDRPPLRDPDTVHYDPFHINSIERTAFGHYLVSMRHTNTIYLISGQDGHVIWRLGGAKSDFEHLDGFNFSAQHDARILTEHMNGTIVMSLLDNAGATGRPRTYWTANTSSVVIAELDTAAEPMTVRSLRRYERPDHSMTTLRGNTQVLPDGNILAGWSSSGYFSEFAPDGTLVMEGSLGSSRMSTYRTFKFGLDEVKLFPTEPIALVCRTLEFMQNDGARRSTKLSVMYVSWNGATEVTRWKFAVADDEEMDGARFFVMGEKDKTGFETVAQFDEGGIFAIAYALDREGNVMGKAAPVKCMDFVETEVAALEFDNPGVYRRPPVAEAVRLPVVDDEAANNAAAGSDDDTPHEAKEQDADIVSEQGKESPSPAATTAATTATASTSTGQAEKEQQQKQKEQLQEQQQPSPTKAAYTPPRVKGIDQTFTGNAPPRLVTIVLLLSVSLAGVLLLMRRLRRGIL